MLKHVRRRALFWPSVIIAMPILVGAGSGAVIYANSGWSASMSIVIAITLLSLMITAAGVLLSRW